MASHVPLRGTGPTHPASPPTGENIQEICIRQLFRMELEEPYLCTEILLRITQILHLISHQKTIRGFILDGFLPYLKKPFAM